MQYSTIFLAAISLALAQAKISFTTLPNSVEANKPVTLEWTGGNSSPVTITLKRGDSTDLKTVQVLTGNGQGESFTWTPSTNLENGDDYALQIAQGVDEINYTGQFTVSGGSGSGVSSSSSSGSASSSSSSSSSSSGYPTILVSSVSASTTIETTVTTANSTSSRSHTVYATGTAPPSVSGTGINVSRNTTFSSATPTRSQTGGLTSSTSDSDATTTSDSDASATSSGAAEPSSGGASRLDIQIGAGIAAIVGLAAML